MIKPFSIVTKYIKSKAVEYEIIEFIPTITSSQYFGGKIN